MKNLILIPFLVALLLIGQFASANAVDEQAAPVESASVAGLIRKLTSPELDWGERFQAEEELKNAPSEMVLLALIPETSKKIFPGWNGTGSAEGDKRLPPKAQISYAVHRLWFYHDMKSLRENGVPLSSVGKRLIEYLPVAASKMWILQQLGDSGNTASYWLNEAEKPVVALFRNPKTDEYLRAAAMRCLLHNTGQKYYEEIKTAILAYPESTDKEIYLKAERLRDVIQDALRKQDWNAKQFDIDTDILRSAFALLSKLEKVKAGGGYFLALALGSYVAQKFQADQSDPKYHGKHGLETSFFANTTARALMWWKENQNKYN